LLDRTVARAKRANLDLTEDLVGKVLAETTGLPLGEGMAQRAKGLRSYLRTQVIGQDEAMDALSDRFELKLRGIDLKPERPNGVFLLTGPTGVGKTETARAMARFLFGSEKRMLRMDMSEYSERHQVAKVLGAPPGYVGYEQGAPLLAELESQPFAVVLLDEMEKAHEAVHRIFLQVFEDGFLTTAAGRRVYFSDAVIVMTSNVDLRKSAPVGFMGKRDPKSELDMLDDHFPRELVNRIDAVCQFRRLELEDVKRILREVTIPGWIEKNREKGIELELTDAAANHLAKAGYSRDLGARELNRVVEQQLLVKVADQVDKGYRGQLVAAIDDGNLVVRPEVHG
jgi:ATP-dependent Clp protease ATP-binding subunit ClpA